MGQNKNITINTRINKNWGINTPITNQIAESDNSVINAIESEIDKFKNSKNNIDKDLSNLSTDKPIIDIPGELSNTYWRNDYKNYFTNAQKWVGHIIEVKESLFVARLDDVNDPTTHEIAEFDFNEISPEDKEFISIGSIFYWAVGTSMNRGQITKESLIRFKRVADWTEEEYNSAIDRADRLYKKFNKE